MSNPTFAESARKELLDSAYQKELPRPTQTDTGTGSGTIPGVQRKSAPESKPETIVPPEAPRQHVEPGSPGSDLSPVVWLILGIMTVLAVMLLIRSIADRSRKPKTTGTPRTVTSPYPEREVSLGDLDSARKAAEEGDYDRATALLLDAALGRALSDHERQIRASQTARRIVQDIDFSEDRRRILDSIVGLREDIHFAGRPPSPGRFDRVADEVASLAEAKDAA